jgi:hypothetical protein
MFSTFLPNDDLGQDDFWSTSQINYVSPPQKNSKTPGLYISRYDENTTLMLTNLLQTILILAIRNNFSRMRCKLPVDVIFLSDLYN